MRPTRCIRIFNISWATLAELASRVNMWCTWLAKAYAYDSLPIAVA